MVACDDIDPLCFFGTASSLLDADDFIFAKAFGGWSVLVPPWAIGPYEWGFVLHKFKPPVYDHPY